MFDFCVVGGGMVGLAIAKGLNDLGFSIAVVEPFKPQEFDVSQPPDLRVSAISLTSEALLKALGAWPYIESMRSCVYRRLSVWDDIKCRTDFNCDAIAHSHLGHIIENRVIQLGLLSTLEQKTNVHLFYGQRVIHITSNETSTVTLADNTEINARMIIAADGGQSMARQAAGIGVTGWQYSQQVLGVTIKTASAQQDMTWQQFKPEGPVAFLPLYDGYGSLVWYTEAKHINSLKSLSNEQLKQHIQQSFPVELGDFELLSSGSFNLTRMHANHYFHDNTVLIGDAAHTINPLAGQGVNLGFKDVAVLLAELKTQLNQFDREKVLDKNNRKSWLTQYEAKRRKDNLLMMSAMDVLYSTFSNDVLPLKVIRNIGLKVANHAGPFKTQALKYAVGLI